MYMSVNFAQFVKASNGNETETDRLIATLYKYPAHQRFWPKTEHLSKQYAQHKPEDLEIYTVAAGILHRQCDAFLNLRNFLKYGATCFALFGYDATSSKDIAMRVFLYARASMFVLSSLGSCSQRASYSSLALAQLLPKEAQVFLVSAPSKDQFVVQLKVADKEWLIYDPLTNPEVLFPHDLYKREVLSKFPDSDCAGKPFMLEITKELSAEFFSKCPDILEKMKRMFLSTMPTPVDLMKDYCFVESMRAFNMNPRTLSSKIQRGIELIQSFVVSPCAVGTSSPQTR
jgi:hypothetical protein